MGAPLCLPQWSQICQTECYPCDRIEALPMCPVGQWLCLNSSGKSQVNGLPELLFRLGFRLVLARIWSLWLRWESLFVF